MKRFHALRGGGDDVGCVRANFRIISVQQKVFPQLDAILLKIAPVQLVALPVRCWKV